MWTARDSSAANAGDATHAMPHILFVVLTSRAKRHRAVAAWNSWCTGVGAMCQFFADAPFGDPRPPQLQWTSVKSVLPRRSCCRNKQGFFCSDHRKTTLAAQYRYLPALRLARRSEAFTSGRAQWVVLLDDDSFVFVHRLRGLLSRYDPRTALMLGEFKPDRSYACGGAGAVLSRASLVKLDLDLCIARMSQRCSQSDWQLGDCVRKTGRIRMEAKHGCGSCAVRNCTSCDARMRGGCQFMQEASAYTRWLVQTANCSSLASPSIVHGGGEHRSVAAALARRTSLVHRSPLHCAASTARFQPWA